MSTTDEETTTTSKQLTPMGMLSELKEITRDMDTPLIAVHLVAIDTDGVVVAYRAAPPEANEALHKEVLQSAAESYEAAKAEIRRKMM